MTAEQERAEWANQLKHAVENHEALSSIGWKQWPCKPDAVHDWLADLVRTVAYAARYGRFPDDDISTPPPPAPPAAAPAAPEA